ncbi:hypothetical protein [Botryobacter ruber]|uniref:hypothetical protein n=1 Tax=Botryobacter ruber TaxID=2171629 RepID=UPI000F648510|nr:hypothetical protein [Botryobacter ruber]
MKRNVYLILFIGLFAFSCKDQPLIHTDCVRGKYIGEYCEGVVIQIPDDHKIGKEWKSTYSSETYKNSVVASIDSLLAKSLGNPNSYFSPDSVFYFKYKDGGYPRKQYNVCEPSAFITITFISKNSCVTNEGK